MAKLSKWIRPGWFVAICFRCLIEKPFQSRELRDEWMETHVSEHHHYVEAYDGDV